MRSDFLLSNARRVIAACSLLLTASAAGGEIQNQAGTIGPELASLDSRYQKFSARFFNALVRAEKTPKASNIESLAKTIQLYRTQNQVVTATAVIVNNLTLVEKNIDTTPIINICGFLLETNEWETASRLLAKLKKQGDKSLVSNVSFSLAKYYFSRNQWKETIGIVEGIRSDLPPEDYHHSLLMRGISLQHLQKHRAALVEYAKIPASSRFYVAARLNMAVANIRQDWWTDAHIIIADLLKDKGQKGESELTDRLYTVLGYSLMQQQYYRNSRDAFRNVSLTGKYTNKALLGLALTAAYQEDYIGALNAINILKDKKTTDLPVDEANLLLPYFYERLKQLTTANTGYLEAIQYYEHRTQSIQNAMPSDPDFLMKQVEASNSGTVTINDEIVDLGEKLPKFIFENIGMLARIQAYIDRVSDTGLRKEYDSLNRDYRDLLRRTAQALLDQKTSYLTHYMNQSRYGLARMQDQDAIPAP